jgi:predicted metal-dependent peptidase
VVEALAANAREELSRCIVSLLLKEPFYGHLLSGIVRRFDDSTGTAAVALTERGVELRISPTFFIEHLELSDERTAVVKHEALHLLFKHLFRVEIGSRNMRLFNIAADLVVNQFVEPWPLPEGAILLTTFPDLDLPPDQTMEWYYDRLSKLQAENDAQRGAGGSGQPDYSQTSAPISAEVLDRLNGSSHSDHSAWAMSPSSGNKNGAEQGAQVPDQLREALENELERHIIQAKRRTGPKSWSRVPGALRAEIDAMIERRKPQISWKRVIRLFSNSSRRTRIVTTAQRESTRFNTFPGIKVKRYQRMAVVVDTSGSVPDADLSRFFAEIHGIWRQGAEVDIIECDAQVQKSYPYRGQMPQTVAGRGGTLFDPAFEWLRAQRMVRYDGCIYLTDGGSSAPTVKPPCKLLWIVTSDGVMGDHLKFGRSIQLPSD